MISPKESINLAYYIVSMYEFGISEDILAKLLSNAINDPVLFNLIEMWEDSEETERLVILKDIKSTLGYNSDIYVEEVPEKLKLQCTACGDVFYGSKILVCVNCLDAQVDSFLLNI